MQKVNQAALAAAILAVFDQTLHAVVTTISADVANGYTITETVATPNVGSASLIGNTANTDFLRLGAASGTAGGRNPVTSFKIPNATSGEAVISVSVIYGSQRYVASTYSNGTTLDFNGDLYAVGTPVGGGTAANRLRRYNESDSSEDAASIKIQDNLFTPTTATNYTVTTSAAAAELLGAYLNNFYASAIGQAYNVNSQARYLTLRLNPDINLGGGTDGLPGLGNPTNNSAYEVVSPNPNPTGVNYTLLQTLVPKIVIVTAKDYAGPGSDVFSNGSVWSPTGGPTATSTIRFGNLPTTDPTITVDSGGTVAATIVNTTRRYTIALAPGGPTAFNAGTLNVTAGTIALASGGSNALRASTLSIAPAGTIDLADNTMVLESLDAAPLDGIRANLAAGRIVGVAGQVVGYGQAGAIISAAGGIFNGQNVTPTSIVLRSTINGDATLDGVVNFDDLVPLAQNYNSSVKFWTDGDFTYDGTVNFDDLVPLAQNYNKTINPSVLAALGGADFAADFAFAQSLVPEPASIATIALTALVARRRRRAD